MQQTIEILGLASRPPGSDESTTRLGLEGAVDGKWSELGVPHVAVDLCGSCPRRMIRLWRCSRRER